MNIIKIFSNQCLTTLAADRGKKLLAHNPTCHEAMRVQKNEQVFTNIITKKTTMAIVSSLVGAISSHFPHSLFFSSPLFSSLLFSPFLFFPPHLFPSLSLLPTPPPPPFLFSFFFLLSFFDLVTRDIYY